jgi:hypothetical protein
MPNLTFLWPPIGPTLVNHHFSIPNVIFASKNYDIGLLNLGSKVLQDHCKEVADCETLLDRLPIPFMCFLVGF